MTQNEIHTTKSNNMHLIQFLKGLDFLYMCVFVRVALFKTSSR